jgi:TonB family protein
MKSLPLVLSAAAALAFGVSAHAAPRDVRDYLDRAGEAAATQVSAAGVDVGDGLDVKARVNSDGRLTGVRVVRSSGSLEADQKAVQALRRLKVSGPPNALLGADVTVAVTKEPIVQAKNPDPRNP